MGQVGSMARSRQDQPLVLVAPKSISLAPAAAVPCIADRKPLSEAQGVALMALVLRKPWLLDYYATALPAPDQVGSRNESSVKALQLVRLPSFDQLSAPVPALMSDSHHCVDGILTLAALESLSKESYGIKLQDLKGALFVLEDFTINPKNFKLVIRKLKLISGDTFETFGKPDPVLEVPVVKSRISAAREQARAAAAAQAEDGVLMLAAAVEDDPADAAPNVPYGEQPLTMEDCEISASQQQRLDEIAGFAERDPSPPETTPTSNDAVTAGSASAPVPTQTPSAFPVAASTQSAAVPAPFYEGQDAPDVVSDTDTTTATSRPPAPDPSPIRSTPVDEGVAQKSSAAKAIEVSPPAAAPVQPDQRENPPDSVPPHSDDSIQISLNLQSLPKITSIILSPMKDTVEPGPQAPHSPAISARPPSPPSMSQASVLAELDETSPPRAQEQLPSAPTVQPAPVVAQLPAGAESPQRIAATPEDPNRKSSDEGRSSGEQRRGFTLDSSARNLTVTAVLESLNAAPHPLTMQAVPPTPEPARQVVAPELALDVRIADTPDAQPALPKHSGQKRSEAPSKAVRGAEDDAVVMSPFHLNWKEKEPTTEEVEARNAQREREELLSRVDRLTNLVAKMEEQMRAKDSELAELRTEVATLKSASAPRLSAPPRTTSISEAPPPPTRMLPTPKIALPANYPRKRPVDAVKPAAGSKLARQQPKE